MQHYYVNMQQNYVTMQQNYVNMQDKCDFIVLHVNIINMIHFDTIYHACRGQKYATILDIGKNLEESNCSWKQFLS